MNTEKQDAPVKKKKVKGPLRLEAIIPVTIILALIFVYFSYFFEGHLRRGIEWAGTQANGAEVNVGRVKVSFLTPSFHMYNTQVTDKNHPERNIVQIGEVNFILLWDALLRAKAVVEDASILNIQAMSPRKKPGYVVPPSPPSEGPSALEKLEDGVLSQTKSQFKDNFLGDLAHLVDGVKPEDQLKNIENQLKSSARIKELEAELKEKEKLWKERLKTLPQGKDIEDLSKRLKALKFDAKNPAQFAASLQEADKILKEADQKIKAVDETGRSLKSDVTTYTEAFKQLDDMVRQDLKDIQARLKIPDLDTKEFTKQLFGNMFADKLVQLQKYMALSRQYMPTKKPADEREQPLIPPPRGQGRNYKFPITKGYPTFWLKRAAISSEPNESEFSGKLSGELKDITTDPPMIGKPMIARVAGDFPKKNISGFETVITIDHTTEKAREDLKINVGSFPLGLTKIANSSDVTFNIAKAKGASQFVATLEDQSLTVSLKNQFTEVGYEIDAKAKLVREILTNVMNGIPMITLNAGASGSWSHLNMNMNSNLGEELSKGFKAELEAKINEAKQKVEKLVNERIGKEKEKLTAEFNKIKNQVNELIDSKKSEVDKAKKQAEATLKSEKDKAQSKEVKKLENEGKKLLKGLGF